MIEQNDIRQVQLALVSDRDRILQGYVTLEVTDVTTLERASEALIDIRKMLSRIETTRKALVMPLNEHVRNINNEFSRIKAPLCNAEEALITKMKTYRQGIESKRAEEQKRLDSEAVADLIPEAIAPIIPGQDKTIDTSNGKITFMRIKKWRVLDLTQVPRDFFCLDEKAISQAVKEGIQIPGIEIYEEEIPQVRR